MEKSISINGMNCAHCTGSVEKALCAVSGVKDAKVDLASKTAIVNTESNVEDETLITAVVDAGFTVVGIQ
jgi:copper chaperone CopZ